MGTPDRVRRRSGGFVRRPRRRRRAPRSPPRRPQGPLPRRGAPRPESSSPAARPAGCRPAIDSPQKPISRSLRRQQPPVVRLAAVVRLGLDVDREPAPPPARAGSGLAAPSRIVTISASSLSASIVAASVEPAPPHAIISPSRKPTASPRTKRPSASSRAAGATEPTLTSARPRRAVRRSPRRPRRVSNSTSTARPACCEVQSITRASRSESSAARSAARTTLGELGRTRTDSATDRVDPREQLVGGGIHRRPAVDHGAPSSS